MIGPRFFSFEELTRTFTPYRNCPKTWEQVNNLLWLGKHLDGIRIAFGGPITVNSGFRSNAVNNAVKGSKNSAHLMGLAADIKPTKGQLGNLIATLRGMLAEHKEVPFDQIIIHSTYVHVGFSRTPRRRLWEEKV